jgi:hypothetical protein
MASAIRAWFESEQYTPRMMSGTADDMAKVLTDDDAANLVVFPRTAFEAWGRSPEYFRLWGRQETERIAY